MQKIYLVTPTWNCGAEFARCVDSVLSERESLARYGFENCADKVGVWAKRSESGPPIRWVVVENGSRPEERATVVATVEKLQQAGQSVVYLPNLTNLGIPVAHNQALDWIRGHEREPFGMILLSADTVVLAGLLDSVLKFAAEHSDAGVIGGAKSPQGASLPVFHDHNGRWYQHSKIPPDFCEGESVDFSMAYITPRALEAGIRFDTGYEVYDGYDQDLCFRLRSWGFRIYQTDAGVIHHGSAAMKRAGYRWEGGGREEWDALRARNVERLVAIWGDWLRPRRSSIAEERKHLALMNRRLIAEAGYRKRVPESYAYLTTEGAALTLREREWLRRAAAEVQDKRAKRGQAVMVNIGVWKGASLHCLRAGAPGARIVGIDLARQQFAESPQAEIWIGDSGRLHAQFPDPIHLLFVDGDHSRQAVEADLAWVEKVAPGGVVAFHDYRPAAEHLAARPHLDGVRQVVDERLVGNPVWQEVAAVDSIKAFVRRET